MMRPGYFNRASIIRMGDLPAGIGSKAKRPGIAGRCGNGFGIGGGFIGFVCGLVKDMQQRPPHGLVKIAPQRIVAEKLDGECGRADERTEIPGKLRTEKKIAG